MNGTNIIPLQAFKDNYIWMWSSDKNVWVVDPGDAGPVIETLGKNHLRLSGILLTHHHHDHSGCVATLLNYQNDITVIACHKSKVPGVTQYAKENDEIICL